MKKQKDVDAVIPQCGHCHRAATIHGHSMCEVHAIECLLNKSDDFAPSTVTMLKIMREQQARIETLEKQYHGHIEYLHPGRASHPCESSNE